MVFAVHVAAWLSSRPSSRVRELFKLVLLKWVQEMYGQQCLDGSG